MKEGKQQMPMGKKSAEGTHTSGQRERVKGWDALNAALAQKADTHTMSNLRKFLHCKADAARFHRQR